MPEVVHAELRLEAILGELARPEHDPGVVDQQIEPRLLADHFRGAPHGRESRQVQLEDLDVRVRVALEDECAGGLALVARARSEEHTGAPAREDARRLVAEAAAGARHERDAPRLIREARLGEDRHVKGRYAPARSPISSGAALATSQKMDYVN